MVTPEVCAVLWFTAGAVGFVLGVVATCSYIMKHSKKGGKHDDTNM